MSPTKLEHGLSRPLQKGADAGFFRIQGCKAPVATFAVDVE